MRLHHLAILCFVAGAVVGGAGVYLVRPARVITDRDIAFLSKKVSESSFPALRTSKWQAWQAMEFFEARADEGKIAGLCSRAIGDFLAAADSTLARGDMDFMRPDIERDREVVLKFLATHPQLKR